MNTQTRITTRAGLWAVIAIASTCANAAARPTAAPSLCTQLAAQMRRSPETVIGDAASRSTDWLPWIVRAKPDQPVILDYDFYRRIAAAWRAQMGPMTMQGVETLPGTDLFMAFGYAGSLSCLYSVFAVEKPGGAIRVVHSSPDLPLQLSEQCGLENRSGGLATVLGRPAYIESATPGPNNDSLLIIAPWLGAAWGDSCPVSIRFTYRQPVRLLYCGADRALCRAARKLAPSVEYQYHTYSAEWLDAFNQGVPLPKFRFGGVPSAQADALVARARRIAKSNLSGTMPSHGPPSRFRPEFPVDIVSFFPLSLGHKPYLASATGGVDPTSVLRAMLPDNERYFGVAEHEPAPDTVFVLYEAPRAYDHRLVPLAVLSMQWQTSALASVQARDDTTP